MNKVIKPVVIVTVVSLFSFSAMAYEFDVSDPPKEDRDLPGHNYKFGTYGSPDASIDFGDGSVLVSPPNQICLGVVTLHSNKMKGITRSTKMKGIKFMTTGDRLPIFGTMKA